METLIINDKVYSINSKMALKMEENHLTENDIRHRVGHLDWSLKDACRVPKSMSKNQYREWLSIQNQQTQKESLALQRKKQNRPWLFDGTPQKHNRGKWCKYLMSNDIFPKVRKDEVNV